SSAPATRAIAYSRSRRSQPWTAASGTNPSATARPRSAPSISPSRRTRSTHGATSTLVTRLAAKSATDSSAMSSGDASRTMMAVTGSAVRSTSEPNTEPVCAPHSQRNAPPSARRSRKLLLDGSGLGGLDEGQRLGQDLPHGLAFLRLEHRGGVGHGVGPHR